MQISSGVAKITHMSKIFIQIASYRDPELLPTLHNLLCNAKYPDNLSFGLVWQHNIEDRWDHLDPYLSDKRFRIMGVDYRDSGGMGWARSKTQSLYDDETYTMQLDGHMRFSKHWDKHLLEMMNNLHKRSDKPFLTAYAFQYEPSEDKNLRPIASTLLPVGFKSNGILFFRSVANKPNQYNQPYRARLVGGHFFITLGQHCKDYAYDPNLYYAGDELTLAVRSYTLGYDLYHPHRNLAWHYYKRSSDKKHWTDYKELVNPKEEYNIKRIQQMLGQADYGIDLEKYGLGSERSLDQYEQYSGIYLRKKQILKSAMDGEEPPVTIKSIDQELVKTFNVSIKEYQRQFILNFKGKLDYIKITLISLDRENLITIDKSISYLKSNEIINLQYSGEKKPMAFRLECYELNNSMPKIKVEKDLEPDIQWI